MSFYHNVFAREHNLFVDAVPPRRPRRRPTATPGCATPPTRRGSIRYRDVTRRRAVRGRRGWWSPPRSPRSTRSSGRTQLLYDEPLFRGMNANWSGLFGDEAARLERRSSRSSSTASASPTTRQDANQWYSVFASGPGIFGIGQPAGRPTDVWSLTNPDHVNGGVNHFGSPFNFPEEFVTVYRLHALVPDLIEFRRLRRDPNAIREQGPGRSRRSAARPRGFMRERGLANWALSMGRQRLGLLALQNHPRFLQNLPIAAAARARPSSIDVAALDIIRDRERGVPRFNEFRRQYGLRQLTQLRRLHRPAPAVGLSRARRSRSGSSGSCARSTGSTCATHSKVITDRAAQRRRHADQRLPRPPERQRWSTTSRTSTRSSAGSPRSTRPHGFAISETQFMVFILNASRRLFSDRFFTSSFRPEFYTHARRGLGQQQRPDADGRWSTASPTATRTGRCRRSSACCCGPCPSSSPSSKHVVNAFDPWARDRGEYYSLDWRPRPGAEADEAFTVRMAKQVSGSPGC